jgi:hypothetical protein
MLRLTAARVPTTVAPRNAIRRSLVERKASTVNKIQIARLHRFALLGEQIALAHAEAGPGNAVVS